MRRQETLDVNKLGVTREVSYHFGRSDAPAVEARDNGPDCIVVEIGEWFYCDEGANRDNLCVFLTTKQATTLRDGLDKVLGKGESDGNE